MTEIKCEIKKMKYAEIDISPSRLCTVMDINFE